MNRSMVRFTESAAPPWWLRLPVVGLAAPPSAGRPRWWRGADGAAGGAVVAAIILLVWGLCIELGQVIYGGVRIDATRLWVGRRSVPLVALDLDSLRYEAGVEVYAVFARGALLSNPLWLPDTVAIDGHTAKEGSVHVVVRTARRDELVAALRESID